MAKTHATMPYATPMLARPARGAPGRPAVPFLHCLVPLLLAASQAAVAASFESVSSGGWQSSCTWFICPPGGAGYPDGGDTASVRHVVSFAAMQNVGTLVLTGTLQGNVASDTLNILEAGYWNSGTFEAGIYNNLRFLDITHSGSIGIQNLHGTLNNPAAALVSQNSSYQMHNDGTVNNAGLYRITNDADIGNSVAAGPVIRNSSTGSFFKTGGTGTSLVSSNIVFDNQGGTIAALSGTLSIGKLTGSGGVLNAAEGAVLKITAADLDGTYTGSGAGAVQLGNGIFDGTATFNLPGGLLQWTGGTIAGTYTNNVALAITGGGHLQGTLNNNGVINQSASFSIVPGGSGVLNNGATFNITNDADIQNSTASGPSIVNALSGRFAKTSGSGTSSVSANILFDNQGGTIAAQSGILIIGRLAGNGGVLSAAPGATLKLQGMDVTGTFTGSGGGTVELSDGFHGAATFALPGGMLRWTGGNIGGALTNAGSLGIDTGAGRLSGGTIVNLGTIDQSANFSMTADGTRFVNSGVVQLTHNASIGNGVSGTPVFSNTAGGSFAKVAGTGTSTVSGIAFDNQGLVTVSSGTLTLADVAQHPTGSNTLAAGSWEVKAGATLNILSGGDIVINQAQVSLSGVGSTFAKINMLADNQGSFSILDGRSFTTAGDLLNPGTLTVGAGSVLTLGGHGTLISTGILRGGGTIVGNVFSSGRATPGRSVGTLSIDGNLSLQAPPGAASETGVLEIELADVSSFDVLAVSGSATLAGVLKVDLLPGYLPTVGDSFAVLSFASWSGGFQAYDLPALTGGLYLQPVLSADRLTLTVAVPEPASWAMMLVGAAALGLAMRRRHTARNAA